MINAHGLDVDYVDKKLQLILRDSAYYTPDEMARALVRIANVADEEETLKEAQRLSVAHNAN